MTEQGSRTVVDTGTGTEKIADGLTINFYPDSDDPRFIAAASEYTDIWTADGDRIFSTIERISGLRFKERYINAVVFADPSLSHPYPRHEQPQK